MELGRQLVTCNSGQTVDGFTKKTKHLVRFADCSLNTAVFDGVASIFDSATSSLCWTMRIVIMVHGKLMEVQLHTF